MTEQGKKKVIFIVNPNAGTADHHKVINLIHKHIDGKQFGCEIKETSQSGDALQIAKEAVKDNVDIVVAVGGDGTVNEVGSALIGSKSVLAIIPKGSGNGLARHMGIPMNFLKSIYVINRMRVKAIDSGKLNSVPFLNVAGLGFDATVSHAFAERHRRGLWGYVKVIRKQVFNIRTMTLTYNAGAGVVKSDIVMLSVANGSQFGNNASIAPRADICDGMFDICTVKSLKLRQALKFARQLMNGRLKNSANYTCFRSARLEVSGCGKLAHVDGEPIIIEEPAVFEILPASLNIVY